jgi:hypothetical protein
MQDRGQNCHFLLKVPDSTTLLVSIGILRRSPFFHLEKQAYIRIYSVKIFQEDVHLHDAFLRYLSGIEHATIQSQAWQIQQ